MVTRPAQALCGPRGNFASSSFGSFEQDIVHLSSGWAEVSKDMPIVLGFSPQILQTRVALNNSFSPGRTRTLSRKRSKSTAFVEYGSISGIRRRLLTVHFAGVNVSHGSRRDRLFFRRVEGRSEWEWRGARCTELRRDAMTRCFQVTEGRPSLVIPGSFMTSNGLCSNFLRSHSQSLNSSRRPRRMKLRNCVAMAADLYRTLGVPKSATKQDIKSAYRKLARQYHPDVNKQPGAEDKFKEISNAYEILSDDEKRPLYDQFGEAGVKGGAAGAGAYATNPFDLFESFFGGGIGGMGGIGGTGFGTRNRSTAVQGDDIRYDMTLEFSEAIFGTEKEFDAVHLETCEACDGSGAKSVTSRKSCQTCGGMGQVMRTQETPFGTFSQVSTCSTCGGEGEVISDYCRKCRGEGRIQMKKSMKVKIPPGVNSGSTLRVRSEGDAGPKGGPAGDLYVFLNVKEMSGIQRDGIHLYSNIAISFTDAILGTVSEVKTVDGGTELQVPAGTQPGDILVLSKMGVPKLNKPSNRGDHYFTVKVVIPTRLSEVEKDLVEELAGLHRAKPALRGSAQKLNYTGMPQPQRVQDGYKSMSSQRVEPESATVQNSGEEGIWGTVKSLAGHKGSSSAKFSSTKFHSSVLERSPSAANYPQIKVFPGFLSVRVKTAVIVATFMALPLATRLLSWMAARLTSSRSR